MTGTKLLHLTMNTNIMNDASYQVSFVPDVSKSNLHKSESLFGDTDTMTVGCSILDSSAAIVG